MPHPQQGQGGLLPHPHGRETGGLLPHPTGQNDIGNVERRVAPTLIPGLHGVTEPVIPGLGGLESIIRSGDHQPMSIDGQSNENQTKQETPSTPKPEETAQPCDNEGNLSGKRRRTSGGDSHSHPMAKKPAILGILCIVHSHLLLSMALSNIVR